MKRAILMGTGLGLIVAFLEIGCGARGQTPDPAAGAPPPAQIEHEGDVNVFKVEHPEQFPVVTAAAHTAAPQLNVTGTVGPDVARNIPVISLASGRIIEIHTRLGDTVTKGELLMKVQSQDVADAITNYRQAVADDTLAKAQLDRAKLLYENGAIAQKDLEVATDTEIKSAVGVQDATDHLKVLGVDAKNPNPIVDVYSPASGVITDQQVTVAAGTQGLASPNAFTISDLSKVWILCDVYENDLHFVRLGEYADIRLNAYPNRVLRGRIDNIGAILDPNIRTAKVRIEVENPGIIRFGMFVTATFYGPERVTHAVVPASAVLHLHDRDWVYIALDGGEVRRAEVNGGDMLPGNMQEILSGVEVGQRVISNALVLQNTVEQ